MSLKHAILGFINKRPYSGYDLWKMFNGSVSNYWSATHTQIYRTLSELAEENMVESELIHQNESPNKKIYSITEAGKQELLKWLKTPLDLPSTRNKFLVQFSFSNILTDEEFIHNIESYIEKVEEKLNSYKQGNHKDYLKYASSERERFLWNMTLECGIGYYEYELKWLKESLQKFKELQRTDTETNS